LLLLVAALLACTGCITPYRLSDDEFENETYTLEEDSHVLISVGDSVESFTTGSDIEGLAYVLNDTVRFDVAGSVDVLLLVRPLEQVRDSTRRGLSGLSDPPIVMHQYTFDFDVVTVPLRWRFRVHDQDPQLSAYINLSAYLGYRTDRITVITTRHRDGFTRHIRRLGYGAGMIAGLTPVNFETTIDMPAFTLGASLMADISGVSFGTAVGTDLLVGNTHVDWPYQGKLWLGLWVGLNIN
jgi:hypothetical protein